MTRDDRRKACIEAMDDALYKRTGVRMSHWTLYKLLDALRAANARVVPIDPPEEIVADYANGDWNDEGLAIWRVICAKSDLTNGPEEKL